MAPEKSERAPEAAGLTITGFSAQLRQYHDVPWGWDRPILIRTDEGDHYVAAVHIDNEQLIIDMGGRVDA